MRSSDESAFAAFFNTFARDVHDLARQNGFYDSERNIGEMIALIHSELSEGLEGHRKGLADEHLPHRSSLEVELADAVIRIMDMAAGLGLDLAGAIVEKNRVNRTRPYRHGKAY